MLVRRVKDKQGYEDVNSVAELKVGDIVRIKIDILGSFNAIVYNTSEDEYNLLFMESIAELSADDVGAKQYKNSFEETKLYDFTTNRLKTLIPKLADELTIDFSIPKPEDLIKIFALEELNQYMHKFVKDNTGMWVNSTGTLSCSNDLYVLTLVSALDDYTITPSQFNKKVVPLISIKI